MILQAAPKEYASVLTAEQMSKGSNLSINNLRAAMNKYYRSVYKRSANKEQDNNDEMVLAAPIVKGKGNGNGKKGQFKGKCHNCGKEGHMVRDCWNDPKNADKRPAWFKPSEVAAVCTKADKPSDELQLVNMNWGKYAEAFAEDDDDVDYKEELIIMNESKTNNDVIQEQEDIMGTESALRTVVQDGGEKMMLLLEDPEIFVIDSGATTHSTGNSIGMINMKNANGSKTRVGNGAKIATKAIGSLPFQDESGTKGGMGGVHLIPGAPFNLISGTKLLTMGYQLSGDENKIVYSKDDKCITFDIKIKSPEGMLLAARLKRTATEVGGAAAIAEGQERTITRTIQQAHDELGHMSEALTRKTVHALGWTIVCGKTRTCESCAIGKARQKNVKKEVPNEKSDEIHGQV